MIEAVVALRLIAVLCGVVVSVIWNEAPAGVLPRFISEAESRYLPVSVNIAVFNLPVKDERLFSTLRQPECQQIEDGKSRLVDTSWRDDWPTNVDLYAFPISHFSHWEGKIFRQPTAEFQNHPSRKYTDVPSWGLASVLGFDPHEIPFNRSRLSPMSAGSSKVFDVDFNVVKADIGAQLFLSGIPHYLVAFVSSGRGSHSGIGPSSGVEQGPKKNAAANYTEIKLALGPDVGPLSSIRRASFFTDACVIGGLSFVAWGIVFSRANRLCDGSRRIADWAIFAVGWALLTVDLWLAYVIPA